MSSKPAMSAPSRLSLSRSAFRSSCAMALALAMAGNGGVAGAQAVIGSVEVDSGGPITRNDAFLITEIGIFSDQVVLNWNLPSSSAGGSLPEVFQPAGTELTFADFRSSPTTTFTVLNRILPFEMVGMTSVPVNRPVELNGTVRSVSGSVQAGEIWFFSPSGIVVGPNATFNVGSLVLTTNDIDTADGLYGTNGTIRFRGPASSLAAVEIQSGAVINAAASAGAYVAIVAPRIVQAGTVGADGHVALVAAEQADITINAGLLNILVTQGTTDANGIVHTGSSGGAESTASDDRQILSLIAIPKNTALTLLLSGSIGYAPAMSAFDDGSSVVLSAGHGTNLSSAELAQNLGNIEIGNTQFTSYVSGTATNAINIAPNGGSVEFEQGGYLTGFRSISAIAEDGESILSNQGLFLRSNQGSTGGAVTIRAEGGPTGGNIDARSLFVAATGTSDSLFPEGGEGIPATGGTVTLQASGGRIAADMISLEAIGEGLGSMDTGGTGTGGTITASASSGGSITTNSFDASASGYGGAGFLAGGDGIGGNVSLLEQGGSLALGYVTLSARGVGASYSGQTGDGQGGTARIDITSGTTTLADLRIEADAESGELYYYDGVSGNATGRADAISMHVGTGATLDITGSASLTADAYAGVRGAGNVGRAGGVSVLVDGGGTLRVGDTLTVSANAAASRESQYSFPDSSPTLTGGTVNVLANGGSIDTHQLRATANAIGTGATGSGGIVTGGTAIVGAAGGGTISTFVFDGPGFLSVEAEAHGGNGPAPSNAFGGTATLFAQDGTLNLDGYVQVSAMATSGDGTETTSGTGFSAQGGTASIELRAGTAGTASLSAAEIAILADGDARGTPYAPMLSGNGGSGAGGTARLSVAAGTLDADFVTIRADGLGGVSAPLDVSMPLQSGDGFGGTANLVVTGGTTTITDGLELVARGFGGHQDLLEGGGGNDILIGTGSLPGNGTGGSAEAFLSGGAISAASLMLDGSGVGGTGTDDLSGMTTITNGGNGTGGNARIVMPTGSSASLIADDVLVQANGLGGRGGTDGTTAANGGNGTAGSAGFTLADGSFSLGATSVQADGIGGDGATGGNGVGGVASFLLNDSIAASAPRSIASLSLTGNGIGGTSDAGPAATETAGQVQLAANVGSSAGAVSVAGDFLAQAQSSVAPVGNGFVGSVGGGAFSVGGNSTITTTRDVSLTIGSGGEFATTGMLAISTPRTVTSTGLMSSGSGVTISANLGISMTDLNSGGMTFLTAQSGSVTLSSDLRSTGLVSILGTSVDIASLGGLSFYDATATTGDISIQTVGDLLLPTIAATGNVTLTSTGGALMTSGLISGADIALSSAVELTSFTVAATGALSLTSTGGSVAASTALDATSITIDAAGDIDTFGITSSGTVSLTSGGAINSSGAVNGASVTMQAGTDITSGLVDATGPVSLTSTGGSINALSPVSGNRVSMSAAGSLNAGMIDSTGTVSLVSGGALTTEGPVTGTSIDITAGSILTVQALSGSGDVILASTGGALVSNGLISGADISLSSFDDLTSSTVAGTGTLSLTSTAGSVAASTALDATSITIDAAGDIDTFGITSSGTVSLTSGGAINLGGPVSGTDILLAAGSDVLAAADLLATGMLQVQAGGALQVNASVVGADISATSADIVISSAGTIGVRGTTRSITLRNANPNSRTFIGGTAQTTGYQVDATELTRLFADNSITLGAFDGPPGSGADLVIGNLALAYGANGNIGTGGTLKIMAPGRVEVSGAVFLTTSSDGDSFSIDPTRIDIITDTGSIIMRDSAGNLQGELELVGGTIAVASRATLARIANLSSQAAINEALGAAAAVPNPDGYLQAGSIVVDAANAFYIANTGATSDYADRRGFTANRLSITTGSASTHISINGVIVDSAGLPVTGKDVVPLVSINGGSATRPGQSSRFSTINGCLTGSSCEFLQQNELTRTKSDIEVPLDPEGSTKPEYLYVLEIEQPEPDDLQPLVDEPVTGVGNDDLWGSNCGPDSAGCPQGGNGQ